MTTAVWPTELLADRRCLEGGVEVRPCSLSDEPSVSEPTHHKSQEMSQVSQPMRQCSSKYIQTSWTAIEVDLFGERAASLQFDAGMSRARAEYLAAASSLLNKRESNKS